MTSDPAQDRSRQLTGGHIACSSRTLPVVFFLPLHREAVQERHGLRKKQRGQEKNKGDRFIWRYMNLAPFHSPRSPLTVLRVACRKPGCSSRSISFLTCVGSDRRSLPVRVTPIQVPFLPFLPATVFLKLLTVLRPRKIRCCARLVVF